ncbi:serine hydrolase [Arthrobacter tumbae]|uniref:serine hydrolase domain-containing protein n=1 Tax=Arthrobacter tumbae TaxID=163874 RepID=UPI001957E4A6|nr:serine hydrolase domain-containing protein [Arthrobacter tumbae]MBM7781435.1 CubicO group peptidase (beta-lactamase class C family) [Arthrobacter tumbae]
MMAGTVLGAISQYVGDGVPGAIVGVLDGGGMSIEATGCTEPSGVTPMAADSLMRISSNTKPMVAAVTLLLAADGLFALDEPVDRFLPELADRRVLRRLDSPLNDTVPAARPITVEDLLTMRLGFGFVFESECPALRAAADADLGIGPPDPAVSLTPDEWIKRFAELPLLEQPGTVWRYELAYAVLGVLLARATALPLEVLLRRRLFNPLGMHDTAFIAQPKRLPPAFVADSSGLSLFDTAPDSRWERRPAFPDARNGLVSTATDLLRFAGALLRKGDEGVLSRDIIEAMTTDRLSAEQRTGPSAQIFLDGGGWGYGLQITGPGYDPAVRAPRYGWGGGLGTLWYSWPEQETAAVLLTQVLPPSPELIRAFTNGIENVLVQ